ncbi:TPA: dTDP-4-dehydrorhamnose reductase [Providencia rettgeri]
MKVIVTGCHGQVGHALINKLKKHSELNLFAFSRNELDITNHMALDEVINKLAPDVIINAAAYTAVDKAESDIESSYSVNYTAVTNLAKTAEKLGALFLHISTDYVFDGNKNFLYLEQDLPNPISIYGKSKLAGETAIAKYCTYYVILRTSWVFGEHGNNFVKTMIKLGKEKNELNIINDQIGGPTYSGDIADALISIMDKMTKNKNASLSGIYHFSGYPNVSWYDFAKAIFIEAKKQHLILNIPNLNKIKTIEYPLPASRPKNSRLNCEKIKDTFGILPSNWKNALQHIKEYES